MQDSNEQVRQLAAENKALQGEIASLRSAQQSATETLQARLAGEKANQESQQRFQTIFEQSKLGNKIIAPDLCILKVNQALVTMLGYGKAELEGTRITEYSHLGYVDHWRELQENLWTKRIPSFGIETVLVTKEGALIWCRVISFLFADGEDTLGYTILEDITPRKNREKVLRQDHHRLQQQQAVLKTVLGAQEEERRRIAESLHNGMGQILFATKLHLARVEATALPGQQSEVHQALEKTRQLLTEAIVETSRVSHELVPLLLKDFGLAKAIEEFCSRFAGTGIQLQCHCFQERISSTLEMAIYRICQELVNNMVKHSDAARGRLEVYRDRDYLYIEAQDNGKGMAGDQVIDTTRPEPGKGIGLSTIRDRVALLEGKLEIDATPGEGTLISIRLPPTARRPHLERALCWLMF